MWIGVIAPLYLGDHLGFKCHSFSFGLKILTLPSARWIFPASRPPCGLGVFSLSYAHSCPFVLWTMNYPRHHWQMAGPELADFSSIRRLSSTTDKLVGLKNPSRGWDEPQLLNEAGTTPSHLLRPSQRLLRGVLDVARTNPTILYDLCMDSPYKHKTN